jgi:sugar/nucleoside kinase (ribokinase family)
MIDLDAVSSYSVLLVGDGIVDEYNFVTPIGKSIKDNTLSTVFNRTEEFKGGVWAAAEHVKGFCAKVDVMTGEYVMQNRRFLEEVPVRKLFTVHDKRGGDTSPECDIASYDLVIVADFGHGTLTPDLITRLTKEARYLAVNAQTNSTNFGFNMITKYPRADFVVLDQLEARLAVHDRDSPIEDVILRLCSMTGFRKVIVTLGHQGAIGYDGAFERQPALAGAVVDTMGAGDAFLAVASPYARAGLSMRQLLRLGNVAGAVECGIVGHRKYITKDAVRALLG